MLIYDYHLDKAERMLKENGATLCLDSSARDWLGKRIENIIYSQIEDDIEYKREEIIISILIEMFHILVLGETLTKMSEEHSDGV